MTVSWCDDNLTATHVDYAIRLNYSTVPNTNRITNWIARGLDSRFQRYTTSGEEATRQPLSLSLTTTLEPDHTPDSISYAYARLSSHL